MKLRHIIITLVLALTACTGLAAQNTATLYFMDEISERNQMNPAFMPRCRSYFDFFLLPNFYVGVHETAFSLGDVLYNQNGRTMSALSTEQGVNGILNKMHRTPRIGAEFRLNLLNFGFRIKPNHYLFFDFGLHADATVYTPKDLYRFALLGTPDNVGVNHFDFSRLGVDANVYGRFGVGYSVRLSPKVTFGAKANFLLGIGNVTTDVDHLSLDASVDNWTISSQAMMRASLPVEMTMPRDENGDIDFEGIKFNTERIRPAGYGASFDLGVTYEPIPYLTVSASVTDLGFICWKNNITQATFAGDHRFDGFMDINYGDSINFSQAGDRLKQLGEDIMNDAEIGEGKHYTSMLNAKFNAAVEYGILRNKISFGLLNQLTFNDNHVYDELTLAVNFRPCQWFKAGLSYSFLNSGYGALGLGLNVDLGAFNLYLISDYVPVSYARVKSTDPEINQVIPDHLRSFNLQFGIAFNIHRFERDLDGDGIANGRDRCPDTKMDFLRAQCPGLKDKELRDKHGCEFDADKDGVADCIDRCPDTPEGVEVDSLGCPVDHDGDGVADYRDKCPDTPEGVAVDASGCPLDADADGVPDYLDECPETPQNVIVDKRGCPVDEDGDGVPDYLDKCPETPAGVAVDANGCPPDADGDGVPDYLDKCPETPRNVDVDASGCPKDADGDGTPDYLDKCPHQPGPAANNGCPELTEVRNVFKKAMNGIQFETGKSTIKRVSFPILDQIVALLDVDTTYNLVIKGHTDNVGNPQSNMKLSKDRAASVRKYLVDHGIKAERLTSEGYGDTMPVESNKTSKGRAKNRRVEFEIVYETITYEEKEYVEE